MSTYEENLDRVQTVARERGLRLNPDAARVTKVVGMMAENHQAVGVWVCPCKQAGDDPNPTSDVCCPCPELDAELAADGHCHCRLFYAAGRPAGA